MRLTTGTGVTMIAVGAVLTFAVSPPRWLVQWIDVIDLGLVLIWVGVLVLAIHVYLYAPRRPKAPKRTTAPPREHTDRYAPGQFAAPRHDERPYSPPPAPAYGSHYQAPSASPAPDDAYDSPTRRYDRPPGAEVPGNTAHGSGRPATADPPDEATQYFRPRRDR